MNEVGNSTIISLPLWLNEPPSHKISAIIYLSKIQYIATGCESGHIIIWQLTNKENELTPYYYFIGHKSKISHFVLAGSNKNTNLEYFVSFSGEGEIALWEAEEGRNIEFISNSQMNIQHVFSFESVNAKQRLILCCLKNREIYILNSMSLSHICTLVCTSSPNWFSSVTSFNMSDKEDVILATTISGLISVWVLNFKDVFNQNESNMVIDADKYMDIATPSPLKLVTNHCCSKIILVITPCQFKIYNTQNWEILSYQDCHRRDYFIDGDFISGDFVLMHCQSGKSFYYHLPPRANYQNSSFMQRSSNILDNIPDLIIEFPQPEDFGLRHKVCTFKSDNKFTIWKGFSNGKIHKWEYPNSLDENRYLTFSLDKSWSNINEEFVSLSLHSENSTSTSVVTSVLIVSDFSLIVLGMESGLIIIQTITDVLNNTFLEGQFRNNSITLQGHVGPVTCLMHPSTTMKLPSMLSSSKNLRSKSCLNLLKLAHILWSGGSDCTVRVWNMKSKKMINIFHCHSAPIMILKLNHLPLNFANICGFSQGFTAAMYNSVDDSDENSHNTIKIINRCMNSFLVGIAENDGISIFSIMKQKLLLFTAEHKSPVRNLGWILDSGYLLVDTIENTVYVWDLSSGVMDRFETGQKAHLLLENCSVITKIRAKQNYVLNDSKTIRRHSLNFNTVSTFFSATSINKLIRCQFIHGDEIKKYVPVLIFNLSFILDSLSGSTKLSSPLYDVLTEMDIKSPEVIVTQNQKQLSSKMETFNELDLLIHDMMTDKQSLSLEILLIKIILSQTMSNKSNFPFSEKYRSLRSFGKVNSKTGCIIFELNSLFQDLSHEVRINTENLIIQLSIINKCIEISNFSNNFQLTNLFTPRSLKKESILSFDTPLALGSSHKSTYLFEKFRDNILRTKVLQNLQSSKAEIKDFSFNELEKIFNRLIFGILDICDTINESSLQLLSKVIYNLTDQQIQNYILVWRLFFTSNLQIYDVEDGRNFLKKIQPFLDKFIEYSYLSSDWVWWYSKEQINTDHETRNLSKIQIKALLNIALLGSHLQPDDAEGNIQNIKLFSKLFSLDKSFLARITCEFFMSVLSRKPAKSKSNIGRLIYLAMTCLSKGFLVWEPYIDSNTVICKFLSFANDLDDSKIEDKYLSSISINAIKDIAIVRPNVFIVVCYREMLRCPSILGSSISFGHKKLDRTTSIPSLPSFEEISQINVEKSQLLLNRNVLLPIFNDLCQNQSTSLLDVLPELVELYVYFHIKDEDFNSFMLPVLKFSSVSINELSGHVSVGGLNGHLFLFDLKFGKYFKEQAHKKAIKLTKFSNDSKLCATYSVLENVIKIWQISTVLFHLGSHPYQVKMLSSHDIPSIKQMLSGSKISFRHLKSDCLVDNDLGVNLEWEPDNKSLFIKLNGLQLKEIRF